MLHRAASNAYSWWLASHIRTKQSKWLEQNLQDMEEKVASVLKLIEEDGDSFRKRAEMYYKKRPELINFVEESYRAYRALAERYDHISTELQNANNTLASCFPDQVPFMDDDDDDASPRFPKKPPEMPKSSNIPNVPKGKPKDFKGLITSATRKLQPDKLSKAATDLAAAKSGMSKDEGLAKIDKLQKRILALQTEKEFIKSSYESGLARYWDTDKEIVQMQNKICNLQDEFGAGNVIEDDEARTLMAEAALKSCEQTLAQLQEKQERSAEEAEVERKRIKDAWQKVRSIKQEFLPNEVSEEMQPEEDKPVKAQEKAERSKQEVNGVSQDRRDLEMLQEKIKEHFEDEFSENPAVSEMAEKIDELVNKVVSLETAISSQTALIQRLRTESDELQVHIQALEDDKATLIDDKDNLRKKLKEMEAKLRNLQDLNKNLEDKNNYLQTNFSEAQCSLEHLTEKLHSLKLDMELEVTVSSTGNKSSQEEAKSKKEMIPSDGFKKPKSVKLDEELKVLGSSQQENPPAESKSQEEFDEQEHVKKNPSDANKSVQVVKAEEVPKVPIEAMSQKDEQESEKKPGDGHGKVQVLKAEEELKVPAAVKSKVVNAEEGLKFPVEAKSQKEFDGQEQAKNPSDGSDKVKVSKAEDEVKVTGSSKKEKESLGVDVKMEERKNTTSRSEGGAHEELDKPSEKYQESEQLATMENDEPDWKQMFLNGIEEREKTILGKYTSVLRNFKETKKKLSELESSNQNSIFELTLRLKDLKSKNVMKDEEIRSLRQKLSLFQAGVSENNHSDYHQFMDGQPTELAVTSEKSVVETIITLPGEKEEKEEIKVIFIDQPQSISPIEEKFRMSIDGLLEENLDFWLRFSISFGQIHNYETSVKDLLFEISKLEERHKQDGSSTSKYSLKSDVRPIYKHLREIQTELTVWLEKSVLLKEELKNRFSSLCEIQEEITKALKDSAEDDDFKFTSYQAAKFQGEVLNMKQENNKVADELQAGLDHIATLQLEVERTLAKLNEDFGLAGSKNRPGSGQLQHSHSQSRVPLRSFIFGVKPKKPKNSLFALNKKYNGFKSGSK
ncbi:hypothetical protein SLEP1_g33230 [Rubroshorea leprosula]|uniref:NAB domain-containing protein n=1 Tax=Rubroshorea leprosula TaxID=152421 RepID=A0AAV5KG12_9ROSI|nr:hypothetical protein SLEP1_g33230 [Rubroshorea leprosula]